MRFKRNVVTIAFAAIFIVLMLLGFVHIVIMSYDRFSQDGIEWIFIITMAIAVLLFSIVAFLLREKAALKMIQKESGLWIVIEGLLVVAAIGTTFYFCLSSSVECGIMFSSSLICIYGICRLMGGRLCGLLGLGFGTVVYLFTLEGGYAGFDSTRMQNVLTFLVPFLAFLLMTKLVIPQFAKKNAIVIIALIVLSGIFGTAIVLNPISCVLCIGCVLALIFTRIRSVDTILTKGFVMALILLVGSGICAFGMSFLLDKDFLSLFSFSYDSSFEAAVSDGSFLMYSIDKTGDAFTNILFHTFDYGIYPAVLVLFAAISGYAAIRRKLSEIGPMLLSMCALLIGYVIAGEPGSHNYYLTYMLAVFSGYGLYNMLLPEFLGRFQDDDDAFDLDEDTDASTVDNMAQLEGRVSDENHLAADSDSASVSQASEHAGVSGGSSPSVPGTAVGRAAGTSDQMTPHEDMMHFQEWKVSEEFVREEKVRRARQAEREKAFQEAKARQQAEKSEPSTEPESQTEAATDDIQFEQPVSEPQVASVSSQSQSYEDKSGEVPLPELDDDKPKRVVFVEQDVGHYLAPGIPDPMEELIPTPENVNRENIVLDSESAQDDTEMVKSLELNPQHEGREMELSESHRVDTDSIVMSGYQNNYQGTVDPYDAAGILTAINETEIPTVELPDVPVIDPNDVRDASEKKNGGYFGRFSSE